MGRQAEPPGTRPWSVPGAPWGSSLPSSLPSLPDQERKLCAHPRLEIYQQDQIYFMCPLARQGDFYVPEMKETERKSRGPAEASDARVDDAGAGGGEGPAEGGARGGGAGPARPEPSLWVCGTRSLSLAGAPPWPGCTVGVQCPPQDPQAEFPVPRHVGPRGCGFTRVTPGDTDAKVLLAPRQRQQGYPWGHRSQTAGCSWWVGTEAAQERRHLGGLTRK